MHEADFSPDRRELTMDSLVSLATKGDDYHWKTSNCHHFALELFNHCAGNLKMVPCAPQTWIEWLTPGWAVSQNKGCLVPLGLVAPVTGCMPEVARTCKEEVGELRAKPCPDPLTNAYRYTREIFPFQANDSNLPDGTTRTAAFLSAYWVYNTTELDLRQGLLDSMEMPVVHVSAPEGQAASLVQWAVVNTAEISFLVFKGTDNLVDVLADLDGTPIGLSIPRAGTDDQEGLGLSIHGGMWTKLVAQGEKLGAQTTIEKIWDALRLFQGSRRIVVCGHSLGGAYAELAALAILHKDIEIMAVMSFGGPMVIEPNRANPLWSKLNDVSKVSINDWDIVPRLPSCERWMRDVATKGSIVLESIQFDLNAGRVMDKILRSIHSMTAYRHVGELVFLGAGRDGVLRLRVYDPTRADPEPTAPDEEGNELTAFQWLEMTPETPDLFVVEHHRGYADLLPI